MKRKLLTMLLMGGALLCTAAGLAACGEDTPSSGNGQKPGQSEHEHSYTTEVIPPTCTEQGYTIHKCIYGEQYVDDYVPALGHTEVVDDAVEPTCAKVGLTAGSHCSVCLSVIVAQEPIEKKPHTEVIDAAVAATCTQTGLEEGKHCSVCTEVLVEQKVVEKISHDFAEGICSMCHSAPYSEGIVYELNQDGQSYYVARTENLTDEDVVIANVYLGKPVTAIGERAFYECRDICSVVIPYGITSIGASAFGGCIGLLRISIPDSVTTTGDWIFERCEQIEEATLPASLIYQLPSSSLKTVEITSGERIENAAFYYFRSLESVTIAEGVTSIGGSAFYGCVSLISVTLPESVTAIESYAFYECSSLESFTIPNGVTVVRDYTFYHCSKLHGVTIPNGVTAIQGYAFYGCESLESVTFPSSVLEIGYYAFKDCLALTSVVIPNGEASCNDWAFSGCVNLEHVTVSTEAISAMPRAKLRTVVITGGTVLYDETFSGCSLLTSVIIPDSVTTIGHNVFRGCDSLNYNVYDGACYLGNENNPYRLLVKAQSTEISECEIHADTKYVCEPAFANCSALESVTIPDGIVYVADTAFSGCTALENATLPTSAISLIPKANLKTVVLTSGEVIEGAAFQEAAKLVSVVLPESLTSIGAWAFGYCRSLLSVEIPERVTLIDSHAFYECEGLLRLTIPDGIETIGDDAFRFCDSLEEVTLPASAISDVQFVQKLKLKTVVVTSGDEICAQAFWYCDKLTSVTIPDSVTSLGEGAFYACRSIESINIPEGVTTISDSLFYECDSLSEIILPKGVTSIGNSAFAYCRALAEIEIPGGVHSIGDNAFYYCSALTEITIPSGVTSCGERIFDGCNALERATVPTCVLPSVAWAAVKTLVVAGGESIPDGAIANNHLLESLTIGDSVVSIGNKVVYSCEKLASITVASGNPKYHSAGNCLIETQTNTLLYGCKGSEIPADGQVSAIADYAFYNQSGLTSITIPESVTSIGEHAFEGCTALEEITIPAFALEYLPFYNAGYNNPAKAVVRSVEITSGKTLPAGAFVNCTALTRATLSNSITALENSVFSGCEKLTHVKMPLRLESIGYYAFENCTSLMIITIPSTVTTIGMYAFSGCRSLTGITLPQDVETIEQGAFSGCRSLTSIVIPDGIKEIGYAAFGGCSGLEQVKMPAKAITPLSNANIKHVEITGVDTVVTQPFTDYSGLVSVTFADNVTSIGSGVFSGCAALTDVTLPKNLAELGAGAFKNCKALKGITLPDGLITIGGEAFLGSGITSIVIPDKVTSIGKSSFSFCDYLESVTIGYGLTSIGDLAFWEEGSIKEFTIYSEQITTVGDSAFHHCDGVERASTPAYFMQYIQKKSLLSAVILSGTSLPTNAFFGASEMRSVVIADSVTSLSDNTFEFCKNLESATLPTCGVNALKSTNVMFVVFTSGERIEERALEDCRSVVSVTIPASVTFVGERAFAFCATPTIYCEVAEQPSEWHRDWNLSGANTCPVIWDYKNNDKDVKGNAYVFIDGVRYCLKADGTAEIITQSTSVKGDIVLLSKVLYEGEEYAVTAIATSAFAGCTMITSVVLPDGIALTGMNAFARCTNLKSVTLPGSITGLQGSAFEDCSSLTDIYFKGTREQWEKVSKTYGWDKNTGNYTVYFLDEE